VVLTPWHNFFIGVNNSFKTNKYVFNTIDDEILKPCRPVADWLNISKHTVYLYIRQFRHEDFPEGEE